MSLIPGRLWDNNTSLSILKDPFAARNIEHVGLHWTASYDKPHAWGYVEFKNGDTRGEQRFEDPTMDGLILKIKAFIESLPREPRA